MSATAFSHSTAVTAILVVTFDGAQISGGNEGNGDDNNIFI
jgi:hypothetical protein